MNYNFYAKVTDKTSILEFIFSNTDLVIFDHYSPYGEEICVYKNINEISSKFDLENGDKFAVTFNLWSPRHKGQPIFKKLILDPKRCKGHTFRYSSQGWGLIQLYFGGVKNNSLSQSHIGHFNEKGAAKWENTNPDNGKMSNWNLREIQITSRKLKYEIHNKLAIRKIGSIGVLSGADRLEKQGIKLC